jgi:hypothetical protein
MRRAVLLAPVLALAVNCDRAPNAAVPLFPPGPLENQIRHFPGRNEGRFGQEGDALNLIFLGDEGAVRKELEAAGWTPVPRSVAASLAEGLEDLWLGRTLTRFPPMNDYRLADRRQDMNWALVVSPIQSRHHFRLWQTAAADERGRRIWWGSGDFDLSVRWIDLSHRPDPDMDAERDFIGNSLLKVGAAQTRLVALPQIPREGRNDKGYPFRTDGRALVVTPAE